MREEEKKPEEAEPEEIGLVEHAADATHPHEAAHGQADAEDALDRGHPQEQDEEHLTGHYGADESGEGEAPERLESAAAAIRVRHERGADEEARKLSLLARIQRLDVGERAKLARGGDKEARSILIKDSNRQVAMSVLANPKITVQEIEQIAASRNVSEDILREIGGNKDWCKSYTVILSLVNNPKTPIPISLTFLNRLFTRDLRFLSKSKGVPEVIRAMAKKQAEKKKF